MWSPSVARVKLVPVLAALPSTVYSVLATLNRVSLADRETVTSPLPQAFDVPLRLVTGAVRSILTAGLLVAVVDRPAPFLTVVALVRPVPSPAIVVSAGAAGMPDSGSAAVQWTLTSPAYQPAALGDVVGAPDRVGAEGSPAGAVEVAVALLPALSVAVPVTVTPGWTVFELVVLPSTRQPAIPEPVSSQVKVTVVVPSGFLTCAAEMVGADLSSRTVTAPAAPTLPRRSACAGAVMSTIPFAVTESLRNGCGAATPDSASIAVQATVGLALFHPAALAAGVRAAVTTGPVLSSTYDACAEPVAPLQLLLLNLGVAVTVTACAPSPAPATVLMVHELLAAAEVT